jgi:hypothetical protein
MATIQLGSGDVGTTSKLSACCYQNDTIQYGKVGAGGCLQLSPCVASWTVYV